MKPDLRVLLEELTDRLGFVRGEIVAVSYTHLDVYKRQLGPEGSDAEGNSCTSGSGCLPSGHIHVADSCIANEFANRAGGCS